VGVSVEFTGVTVTVDVGDLEAGVVSSLVVEFRLDACDVVARGEIVVPVSDGLGPDETKPTVSQ
jgi:hypothetical protein